MFKHFKFDIKTIHSYNKTITIHIIIDSDKRTFTMSNVGFLNIILLST